MIELLSDPVRARIYIEVLVNTEVTAQQLMERTKISRSTMSHHLTRFVKAGLLKVRIEGTGRPVKYYSIDEEFSDEVIIEGKDGKSRKKKVMFLESASAHLQVISSLIQEKADSYKKEIERSRKGKVRKSSVTFTFSFLSEEEISIWGEEYSAFQGRVRTRLDQKQKDSPKSIDYIVFGGATPTHSSKE